MNMWRQKADKKRTLLNTNPFGLWERFKKWRQPESLCQWVEPSFPGSPRYSYCEKQAIENNLCQEHLESWQHEKKIHNLRKRYGFRDNPVAGKSTKTNRNLLGWKQELPMHHRNFPRRKRFIQHGRFPRRRRISRRTRPWRRNSASAWGGPLYRRNLLPVERRQELRTQSPGNFRRPTLAVTEDYLSDWRKGGITKPEDFVLYQFEDIARKEGTTPAIERAKELNRYDEASHYWNQYLAEKSLFEADPKSYSRPKYTYPVTGDIDSAVADVRDFGDYDAVSRDQAYDYLYQFLARNADKRAAGEPIDDVRAAPFKWRFRDAVLSISPEEATKLVKNTFANRGLRAPKWYLPENLYDDLGELFPEVEEAGEEAAANRRHYRRRRLRRRHNPWY